MGHEMYSRDLVESLLGAMWNHGVLANALAADADMPQSKANPSLLGGLIVELIDISNAWDRTNLSWDARQAVCMRYGFGFTYFEVAQEQHVHRATATRRIDRSVSALQAEINGRLFVDEYGEEENDEQAIPLEV